MPRTATGPNDPRFVPKCKKESQNKSPFRAEKYFKAARWTSRYADPLHYRVCGGGRDNSASDYYYYYYFTLGSNDLEG